ncbi:MAG: 3'-5' exonuclease [Candidatus Cardinium sp.]|uniref:3'-5' exonuclease n=1 Tax=Cardinium endosymbiont of Dermatophagoides farinae TaxID=2597823 RepID=UPI001182F24F|nr:3'-5' exonuclease [Cardinium endosymbiont of Dermatophagoides farinae]TSJ80917.1 3'-5' exonuclease [Cardinium endosymbiont of Dermatophagoides farinae]UWW96932.1 MAG: 3'-5' exonuclease [Candidatus Cardinium sp.]
MSLKLTNPLAFLDLETTGTNVVHDRIVEIAIIKLMPGGNRLTFYKRINPEQAIPIEASLIHGIYAEDVADKPTFKQIGKELISFLKGADLAGFNLLRFDIPILAESFLRADLDFKIENRKIVDVQKLFHLMEKRTLKAAYLFYCQKELEGAHNAMVDIEATVEVLMEQVKRYENQSVVDALGNTLGIVKNDVATLHDLTNTNMVDFAGRIVYNEQHVPIFNFGKHKGKTVSEVFKLEPSYYNWMIQGDFPLDTKRKLTQIKMGMI